MSGLRDASWPQSITPVQAVLFGGLAAFLTEPEDYFDAAASETDMYVNDQQILNEDFATGLAAAPNAPDLVCLSHLRWDFVYQRPQHLLSRCAAGRRVFFVEEPV